MTSCHGSVAWEARKLDLSHMRKLLLPLHLGQLFSSPNLKRVFLCSFVHDLRSKILIFIIGRVLESWFFLPHKQFNYSVLG